MYYIIYIDVYIYIYIHSYYIYYIHVYIYIYIHFLENISYENCSHFWEHFRYLLFEIFVNHVPIYSQIHRIRIRYSKYQFIIQNTPNMSKYSFKKYKKIEKSKYIIFNKKKI